MTARRWWAHGAIVLVLCGGLFLFGCGGGAKQGATPSPTPQAATPTPRPTATSPTPPSNAAALIKVEGPLAQGEAMTEANLLSAGFFAVDAESGAFYVVRVNTAQLEAGGLLATRWIDRDTLLLSFRQADYRIGLDGAVSVLPPSITMPPTPGSVASADGGWTALKELGAYTGTLVEKTDGTAKFRLTNAHRPMWSPTGHLLAVLGSVCAGFDVFVFDPVTAELRNLTANQPIVFDYLWQPGGGALAVDVIPPEDRRIVGLLDVETGTMETLVDYAGSGDFPLDAWSPDGARLLFGYNPGRGACEDLGDPAVPTPEQTNVEVLSQ